MGLFAALEGNFDVERSEAKEETKTVERRIYTLYPYLTYTSASQKYARKRD
jgi:hypothetical protein